MLKIYDESKNHKSNDFIGRIGSLMKNDEFRSFFNEYFSDWDDIKIVVMMMKTYSLVEQYVDKNDPEMITTIVRKLLMHPDYRKHMINGIQKFMEGDDYSKYILSSMNLIEN